MPNIMMSLHAHGLPFGRRKRGTTAPFYRKTSPCLMSRQGFGSYVRPELSRDFRTWQIKQIGRTKLFFDKVRSPRSHVASELNPVDFDTYMGFKTNMTTKTTTRMARRHMNDLCEAFKITAFLQGEPVGRKRTEYLCPRDVIQTDERDVVYLSPYEYEHRKLASMNATRGLNPRRENLHRSRHVREGD